YLRQQGVRRVFGVPGLETLNLQEAFAREGIEFIATHHESAAAFMASVTGQLTGVPGVALATRGPGSANLFAGVAEAWLDRAPLLAISADTDPDRKPTTTHQGLDLMGIYRPVTKYCAEVTADNVAETLPRAFEATRRGLPGPSFLAFPNAEAGKQIPDSTMPVLVPEEQPSPKGIAFDRVVALLRESQRPVVYVGLGVEYARAQAQARAFAEALGAPVVVTPKAKGHFPGDHPLYVGVLHSYQDQPIKEMIDSADLTVALGVDGTEFLRAWTHKPLVLSLSSANADERCFPNRVYYEADLAATLAALVDRVGPPREWGAREAAERRAQVQAMLDPSWRVQQGGGPLAPGTLAPQVVIRTLQRLVSPETIVACDIGAHKLLTCQLWQSVKPKTYFTSNGQSAMGSSLAHAVGLALERPQERVLCFMGDGGLGVYTGELETLARYNLNVLVVAWVDQNYGIIRLGQESRGAKPSGVEFARTDFVAVARGFGLWAKRVAEESAVEGVLREALGTSGPALVEVPVDYNVYRGMDF
ncbi:MAG TPA: thiamine pyrophosphate-binding protein, partial [Chloroflexota bacterium]